MMLTATTDVDVYVDIRSGHTGRFYHINPGNELIATGLSDDGHDPG